MSSTADAGAKSADGVLVLPAVLDLTNAAELKGQLEAALAAAPEIVLDASAIQRVTTPALQILAAAKRSFAEAGGAGLRYDAPSTAFFEATQTLGLAALFEISGEQG